MKAFLMIIMLISSVGCSHLINRTQETKNNIKVSSEEIEKVNQKTLNKTFEQSKIYRETLNNNLKTLVINAKKGETIAVIEQPQENICRAMYREMKKRNLKVIKRVCSPRGPSSIFEEKQKPYMVIDLEVE